MAARAVSDALEPVGPEGVELAAQEGLGRPIRPDRTQERTLERPLRVSPVYTPQVIEEIQDKALLGRYRIRGFGTLRRNPDLKWRQTPADIDELVAKQTRIIAAAAPLVKPGGRPCGCGRRGCLEAYAGRARMELRARQLHKQGHKTILFKIMEKSGRQRLSSGVYARALAKGDRMTQRLIDEATWALGIALASAQNLLDLEAIIVGGGLGDRLGQPFVDRVVEQMTPHLFVPDKPPLVLRTELGDLSGAVGAAVLAGG